MNREVRALMKHASVTKAVSRMSEQQVRGILVKYFEHLPPHVQRSILSSFLPSSRSFTPPGIP